jgi:hypothetical protein
MKMSTRVVEKMEQSNREATNALGHAPTVAQPATYAEAVATAPDNQGGHRPEV